MEYYCIGFDERDSSQFIPVGHFYRTEDGDLEYEGSMDTCLFSDKFVHEQKSKLEGVFKALSMVPECSFEEKLEIIKSIIMEENEKHPSPWRNNPDKMNLFIVKSNQKLI